MRILSQQLNSFEREAHLITNQNKMIAYINEKLEGKAEVVHINTPSNRWYHATKYVNSLWGIGTLVKGMVRTSYDANAFKSETLSKNLNVEALSTYVKWFTEDLESDIQKLKDEGIGSTKKIAQLEEKLKQFKKTNERIRKLKQFKPNKEQVKEQLVKSEKILEEIQEILQSKKLIEVGSDSDNTQQSDDEDSDELDLRAKLSLVKEDSEAAKEVNSKEEVEIFNEIKFDFSISEKILEKTSLMRQFLGSQLGIKDLDRGQEGMAIQMLSDKLGVTCAINCKSGLDRTGFWHAVKLAMLSLEKSEKFDAKRMLDLVTHWEETTDFINKISARQKEESLFNFFTDKVDDKKISTDIETIAFYGNTFGKDLFPVSMSSVDFSAQKKRIIDVIKFRNEVLKNLIEMGVPITTRSTGVMGLKWGSGWQENLIPLNFLPSHVKMENEKGKLIPLVKYSAGGLFSSEGEIEGLTKEGALLLVGFSKLRGS